MAERDLDIGRPRIISSVTVENFSDVITAINDSISKADEVISELEKIKTGASLILEQDLDEV